MISSCRWALSQIQLSIFFLFLCAMVPSAQSQSDVSCRSLFQCGTVTSGFPFWGENRPEFCGHPGLELTCDNITNRAELEMNGITYNVLFVYNVTQSLRLARKDYLSGSLCSPQFANTTLDSSLFEYAPGYKNFTVFYRGTVSFQDPWNFTCSENEFISVNQDSSYYSKSSINIRVTVPQDFNLQNPSEDWSGLRQILRVGFAVRFAAELNASSYPCQECVASGGVCGFNSQQVCHCGNFSTVGSCSRAPPPEEGLVDGNKNCRATFRCANQQDIGYPFWGSSQPAHCGLPEFQLNCTGELPEMEIKSVYYKVLAINKTSKTLRLVRTDYMDTLCARNLVSSTVNQSIFGFRDTLFLTLVYGCPDLTTMANLSAVGFFGEFGRSGAGRADGRGYYWTRNLSSSLVEDSEPLISSAVRLCGANIIVPLSESVMQKVESNASLKNLENALNQGFDLRWHANDSECGGCQKVGGVCRYNQSSDGFICFCGDEPHGATCAPRKKRSSDMLWKTKLAIGGSAFVFAIIVMSIALILHSKRRKPTRARKNNYCDSQNVDALITLKRYSYAKVKKMTNSFEDIVGRGGYGTVYRGKLPDGVNVAVKLLNESKGSGEEFVNEVASMSKTSHMNIVSLLGFCYEGSKRAIVYEYVSNGSLDKFLSNQESSTIEWKTLYEIALGTARGLEYLHSGCQTRIVHFDIKPQNILLDEDLCPKISDFGLAKLCGKKESVVSLLDTRGTFGYIAPEVFSRNYGRVSHKSDVYSYGMLVLEMVGARKNDRAEPSATSSSSTYFPDWIYKDLEREENARLLGDDVTEEEEGIAKQMILVGLWCIQTNPSDRPPMSKVVEMMEGTLDALQVPPKPVLFHQATSLQESPLPAEESSISI